MQSITPCLRTISDRFPVASFVVRVPPDRSFEIACATDPALLRPDGRHRRTGDNFYTSRAGGLLRAPAGQATVLLPSDQLRRFAGKTRLYYVLGSYGPRGEEPRFSAPPQRAELIPSVHIAPGFSGRSLDRSRMTRVPVSGKYGAARPVLTWGGDLLAAAESAAGAASASGSSSGGARPTGSAGDSGGRGEALAYDDGYGPDLWTSSSGGPPAALGADLGGMADLGRFDAGPGQVGAVADDPPPSDLLYAGEGETYGGAGSHELYGRPTARQRSRGGAASAGSDTAGFEDAPALRRAGRDPGASPSFGGVGTRGGAPGVGGAGARGGAASSAWRGDPIGGEWSGSNAGGARSYGGRSAGAAVLGSSAMTPMAPVRRASGAATRSAGGPAPTSTAAYGTRGGEPPGAEDAPGLARSGQGSGTAYGSAARMPRGAAPSAARSGPTTPGSAAYGAAGSSRDAAVRAASRSPLEGQAGYGARAAASRPGGRAPGGRRGFPLPMAPRRGPAPRSRWGSRAARARALEDAPVDPGAAASLRASLGAASVAATMAVDDVYEDADPTAGVLGIPPELAQVGEALSIRRKLELVVPVADLVSGADRHAAVAGDVEFDDPGHPAYQRVHHGLHWGLVGSTQRSGLVGRILLAARRRDAALVQSLFGPAADELIRVANDPGPDARLQPVEAAFLWQAPWLDRFRRAGQEMAVQAAQNEVVVEQLLDAQLPFAAHLGLTSDRALAIVVDRCAHMGVGGGRQWLVDALSPVGDDPEALAAALAALGLADLAALQARVGLPADGRLTAETHAALLGALRTIGAASPFALPALPAALDQLVAAAQGRRFAARLDALRRSAAYRDVPVQIG